MAATLAIFLKSLKMSKNLKKVSNEGSSFGIIWKVLPSDMSRNNEPFWESMILIDIIKEGLSSIR